MEHVQKLIDNNSLEQNFVFVKANYGNKLKYIITLETLGLWLFDTINVIVQLQNLIEANDSSLEKRIDNNLVF